jgi:hypothetical protein
MARIVMKIAVQVNSRMGVLTTFGLWETRRHASILPVIELEKGTSNAKH